MGNRGNAKNVSGVFATVAFSDGTSEGIAVRAVADTRRSQRDNALATEDIERLSRARSEFERPERFFAGGLDWFAVQRSEECLDLAEQQGSVDQATTLAIAK